VFAELGAVTLGLTASSIASSVRTGTLTRRPIRIVGISPRCAAM